MKDHLTSASHAPETTEASKEIVKEARTWLGRISDSVVETFTDLFGSETTEERNELKEEINLSLFDENLKPNVATKPAKKETVETNDEITKTVAELIQYSEFTTTEPDARYELKTGEFFWEIDKTEDSVNMPAVMRVQENGKIKFRNGNFEGQDLFTVDEYKAVLDRQKAAENCHECDEDMTGTDETSVDTDEDGIGVPYDVVDVPIDADSGTAPDDVDTIDDTPDTSELPTPVQNIINNYYIIECTNVNSETNECEYTVEDPVTGEKCPGEYKDGKFTGEMTLGCLTNEYDCAADEFDEFMSCLCEKQPTPDPVIEEPICEPEEPVDKCDPCEEPDANEYFYDDEMYTVEQFHIDSQALGVENPEELPASILSIPGFETKRWHKMSKTELRKRQKAAKKDLKADKYQRLAEYGMTGKGRREIRKNSRVERRAQQTEQIAERREAQMVARVDKHLSKANKLVEKAGAARTKGKEKSADRKQKRADKQINKAKKIQNNFYEKQAEKKQKAADKAAKKADRKARKNAKKKK